MLTTLNWAAVVAGGVCGGLQRDVLQPLQARDQPENQRGLRAVPGAIGMGRTPHVVIDPLRPVPRRTRHHTPPQRAVQPELDDAGRRTDWQPKGTTRWHRFQRTCELACERVLPRAHGVIPAFFEKKRPTRCHWNGNRVGVEGIREANPRGRFHLAQKPGIQTARVSEELIVTPSLFVGSRGHSAARLSPTRACSTPPPSSSRCPFGAWPPR